MAVEEVVGELWNKSVLIAVTANQCISSLRTTAPQDLSLDIYSATSRSRSTDSCCFCKPKECLLEFAVIELRA